MLCLYCRDDETGSDDSSVPCKGCCIKEQEFIENMDMGDIPEYRGCPGHYPEPCEQG
jgi:hypothetical protein